MTTRPPSNKKKILVIDDESAIVTYLTTLLEDEEYDTCSANDTQDGLAMVQEQRPDLITLDIMMPKQSGLALYQKLKRDPDLSRIPVIFVTAFSRSSDMWPAAFRKMVPDGDVPLPEAYLEKPIVAEVFLETVTLLIRCATPQTTADGGAVS